jgi:anti-anti-sigma regulatory factor
MLRITTTDTDNTRTWVLEGQLAGPFVAELSSSWDTRQAHESVVDLTGVTFIDESGARVLCAMEKAGVRFIARGVDTRHLLDDLQRKTTPHLRRCLSWMTCRKDEAKKQ